MSQYLKDDKGRFAGSIGDGRDNTPTPARAHTPTEGAVPANTNIADLAHVSDVLHSQEPSKNLSRQIYMRPFPKTSDTDGVITALRFYEDSGTDKEIDSIHEVLYGVIGYTNPNRELFLKGASCIATLHQQLHDMGVGTNDLTQTLNELYLSLPDIEVKDIAFLAYGRGHDASQRMLDEGKNPLIYM